jgi:hypothetical protein
MKGIHRLCYETADEYGDPEKASAARNYIIFAAIGLAVAMLAKAIPAVVTYIVGG